LNTLQSTIEAIQNAHSQEEAFGRFCGFIRYHGYERAGFSLMTDHASVGLEALHWQTSNFPDDWMAHYKEHEFHTIDPVFQLILSKPGAFFWSQAIPELSRIPRFETQSMDNSRNMMHQAEDAGLADGIGVSFVNAWGEVAGLGISRSHSDSGQDVRSLADIYLLSAVFHEKYLSFYDTRELPSLTQREKDVLCWSASGKTDWEIAEITGISRATVRFHWNNIFRKMGVNNKMSATVNAVRRKLIIPDAFQPNSAD